MSAIQSDTMPPAFLDSAAWRAGAYRVADDILLDCAIELADIENISVDEASRDIDRVLSHYHYRQESWPHGIDRTRFALIVHLTQPFRAPQMTTRMDWVHEQIQKCTPAKSAATALDYGGGGGKDSILMARWGYGVTYTDFLSPLTPLIEKRYEIRGLRVAVMDVRDLAEERFDLINCMDVIEHVYDVEQVTADIVARLKPGGILACWPCFFNSWNGDHVEKNCGYRPYYSQMLDRVGVRLIGTSDCVQLYQRVRPAVDSFAAEVSCVRKELYGLSLRLSQRAALKGSLRLAFGMAGQFMTLGHPLGRRPVSRHLDTVIDNLAIRRLSKHRLAELS